MTRSTLDRKIRSLAVLATLFALTFRAAVSSAAISDCIDATCRITAADGGRGTGCVFEIDQTRVYVLTAAHVVGSHATVQCEFWRQGHQSQPLTGRVTARCATADAAIVTLPAAIFGNRLPRAIPLAPRDYLPRPGETLTSVGCAGGAWSTGWKGHALECDRDELRFVPAPAGGRSGSAVFDAEGCRIVGLLRARTGDNAQGIATSVQAIYRVFDAPPQGGSGELPRPTQCGPGGCAPLLPFRKRQEPSVPESPEPRSSDPWPTLPEASPGRAPVDLAPLDEKLGRIARMLESMRGERAPQGDPSQDAGKTVAPPATDEQARGAAETALGQVAQLRADSERDLREVKADAAKVQQGVSGLTAVVEKIKDSLAEDGTLSQRFHARVDKVRADLEDKLGREATDREVRIGYVRDLIQEKVADGGLVGLAKALGLPMGLVLVVWLVTRDVKHKRETGDPLLIEKLASRLENRFGAIQQRFDSLRERVHGGDARKETSANG